MSLSDKSKIVFCRDPGCANETKSVFCDNVNMLKDNHRIEPCSGPPDLNKVCQQDSRAYVNTTEKSCDFERLVEQGDPHIPTSECTDLNPCNWSDVTALPPPLYNNNGTDIGAGGGNTFGNTINGTLSPGETSPGNSYVLYGAIGGVGIFALICFLIWYLKKRCEDTNCFPMRSQGVQVGNGNNGTTSESEDNPELVFIPPPHSSGA